MPDNILLWLLLVLALAVLIAIVTAFTRRSSGTVDPLSVVDEPQREPLLVEQVDPEPVAEAEVAAQATPVAEDPEWSPPVEPAVAEVAEHVEPAHTDDLAAEPETDEVETFERDERIAAWREEVAHRNELAAAQAQERLARAGEQPEADDQVDDEHEAADEDLDDHDHLDGSAYQSPSGLTVVPPEQLDELVETREILAGTALAPERAQEIRQHWQESEPDAEPEPEPAPTQHRDVSELHEIVDGGFGWGSAAPIHDGARPLGHAVKASSGDRTFLAPGDEWYDSMTPDVWFVDVETAERAGFHRG